MSDPSRPRPASDAGSHPAAPSGRAADDGDAERLAEALARTAPPADDGDRVGPPVDERRAADAAHLTELVTLAAALVSLPALPGARRAAIDRALGLPDAAGDADVAIDLAPDPHGVRPGAPGATPDAPPTAACNGGLAVLAVLLLLLVAAGLRAGRSRTHITPPVVRTLATPGDHLAVPAPTPIRRRGAAASGVRATGSTAPTVATDVPGGHRDEPMRTSAAARRPPAATPIGLAAPAAAATSSAPETWAMVPAAPNTDAPPEPTRRTAASVDTATPAPTASPTEGRDTGACTGPAAPHTLTVHVVDGDGGALSDAEIAVGRAPDGPLDLFAVTGGDGCRRVGLSPGDHHVRASWNGLTRWFPSAAERGGAAPVAVDDAPRSLTIVLARNDADRAPEAEASPGGRAQPTPTAGAAPSGAEPAHGTTVSLNRAGQAAGPAVPTGTDAMRDAAVDASALPDRVAQTGGAVTNVAHDAATGTVWAVVGPRLTAWRLAAGGWIALGQSDVLPAVPEALAVGDGHVAIGLMGRGHPAEIWLFDARAVERPAVRTRIPLLLSRAATIGAVAVGGQLAWAVTDRGVSIVDLKPAALAEVGVVATADGRSDAMDALDWQGDVAVLGEPRYAAVVRPWGLWVIDALDPHRPRVRSSPDARASRPRWPSFVVDARGSQVAFVDAAGDGPGWLTVLDVGDPDRPVVRARSGLADAPPAAGAESRPLHIRDDPRGGRSRGAAAAWRGDGVTVLSADARWWAHAALRADGPAWTASGTSAPWDASRAGLTVLNPAAGPADGAPPDAPLPPIAVAGGDAGLHAHVGDGQPLAAAGIAPPLWQTVLGANGRTLIGAAGRAGLATLAIGGDAVALSAVTQLVGGGGPAEDGQDCGAVVAVADDASDGHGTQGDRAVALTSACGLVTLALASNGRAHVLGRLDWLAPQRQAVAHAVPLVVRDGWAAWVEAEAEGRGPFVAVADVRSPERPRRTGRIRPHHGVPIALGAAPDSWLVVSSSGVGATLEDWPSAPDAGAPRTVASLARNYQVIAAEGDDVRLAHPAEGPGTALVALEPAGAVVRAERHGWGFGAIAPADSAFDRGAHLLASDGAMLVALDVRYGLAPVGQPVALPHGQMIDAWGTSPQRDDVFWTRGDAYVALGDAGVLQLPGEALGARPSGGPSSNGRPRPIYLPRLGAEAGTASLPALALPDRRIILFDGTAAAAAWLSANGGPNTLAVALRAATADVRPTDRLTLARWDDWAVRLTWREGDDAGARALAEGVAAAPGRERRADAALALAADVLDEGPPGAGTRHVILVAAGDIAADSVAGAAGRARRLHDGGARLTITLLGPARSAPGLSTVAGAAGGDVRPAVNAAALVAAMRKGAP